MFGAISRSERGLTTSVQWAVLLPLLLGVVVGACDAATLLNARGAVQSAASVGAEADAWFDAGPGTAQRAVSELVQPTALENVDLTVQRASDHTVVTVDATVRLITGERHISHTASAPLERAW